MKFNVRTFHVSSTRVGDVQLEVWERSIRDGCMLEQYKTVFCMRWYLEGEVVPKKTALMALLGVLRPDINETEEAEALKEEMALFQLPSHVDTTLTREEAEALKEEMEACGQEKT
jgi:hypothetical protein